MHQGLVVYHAALSLELLLTIVALVLKEYAEQCLRSPYFENLLLRIYVVVSHVSAVRGHRLERLVTLRTVDIV